MDGNRLAPVFVHSSFRVSSTWLFAHLRDLPETVAYYEIFHERLATLTEESLEEFTVESWESGHPQMDAYFAEFRPLIREGGGVEGFDGGMSYERFVPPDGPLGDISPAEKEYVQRLIDMAQEAGKVPVLTCGRTLARAAGLKRAFGGYHIFLLRDLLPQWISYVRNTNCSSYYFLTVTLECLMNAAHDPYLGRILKNHVQSRPAGDGGVARFREISGFLEAFLALHGYTYLAAFRSADLILNVSDLAAGRLSRPVLEKALLENTGLAPDLSDVTEHAQSVPECLGTLDPDFCWSVLDDAAEALELSPQDDAVRFVRDLFGRFVEGFPVK